MSLGGLEIAVTLFQAEQPLAAAVVFSQLARSGESNAELWCGLGASLMSSRGVLVRKPFEIWAAKAFRRGAPLFAGGPFEEVANDWRGELRELTSTPALTDAELPELIEFLMVNEAVLTDAVAALPPGDAMGAVMTLGDLGDPLYVPLLRAAIVGRLGGRAARSALKRIGPFLSRPDVQASLLVAAGSPIREELGPYLDSIFEGLPAGWDAPRAAACPPYEGVGPAVISLVSAGPHPAECASALCEHLGAAPRDADSWIRSVPCVIKRGATRDDARQLTASLASLGAELATAEDDRSSASERRSPAAATKPWWKIW